MRFNMLFIAALALCIGGMAYAELQNVEVGGNLRIRGNFYDFDSGGEMSFVEQRTRLNVKADFTDDVSAFIEFDYYNNWGEDFRSLYLTGADFRGGGGNDVDLYQGYIEARNMWDTPISMRVGRQELAFGSQWLVGVNDKSSLFTGLSFDALRLTYATDVVTIDAVAAKLAESLGDFGDDDVDLYGVYASYLGIEDVTLDAYWWFVRDDQGVAAGLLNGGDVDLHTLGLRGAGVIGAFDFELEAAYQIGDVDGVPSACPVGFGEADVDYDEFGINAVLGYTFDATWQPRVFAGFAYLGGGDSDDSCWSNDRDMPFNRLFSNTNYCEFLDMQQNLSNMLVYRLGVQVAPTERLTLMLAAAYLMSDEEAPDRGWWLWKDDSEEELALGIGLSGAYHYSEDLVMRAGYCTCWADEGFETNAGTLNGLAPWGGDEDDNCHYAFVETEICF